MFSPCAVHPGHAFPPCLQLHPSCAARGVLVPNASNPALRKDKLRYIPFFFISEDVALSCKCDFERSPLQPPCFYRDVRTAICAFKESLFSTSFPVQQKLTNFQQATFRFMTSNEVDFCAKDSSCPTGVIGVSFRFIKKSDFFVCPSDVVAYVCCCSHWRQFVAGQCRCFPFRGPRPLPLGADSFLSVPDLCAGGSVLAQLVHPSCCVVSSRTFSHFPPFIYSLFV